MNFCGHPVRRMDKTIGTCIVVLSRPRTSSNLVTHRHVKNNGTPVTLMEMLPFPTKLNFKKKNHGFLKNAHV